jgi:hypothetical protein
MDSGLGEHLQAMAKSKFIQYRVSEMRRNWWLAWCEWLGFVPAMQWSGLYSNDLHKKSVAGVLGMPPPSTESVVQAIEASGGEAVAANGAAEANALGLTTQVPTREVILPLAHPANCNWVIVALSSSTAIARNYCWANVRQAWRYVHSIGWVLRLPSGDQTTPHKTVRT